MTFNLNIVNVSPEISRIDIIEEGLGSDGIILKNNLNFYSARFLHYDKLGKLAEENTPETDAKAGKILMDQLRGYMRSEDENDM